MGRSEMDPAIDLNAHLRRIVEAIDELRPLSAEYAAPAPECVQFLGTIVDNTIGLLTAPANALDQGGRQLKLENPQHWLSLMQAVHRSFFSSVHTATEAGLAAICRQRRIEVRASLRLRAEGIVERLGDRIGKADAKEILSLTGTAPQFRDYLDAVLAASKVDGPTAATWKEYFRALSIIRNKVSHSDSTLTNGEVSALYEGGFESAVTDGELRVNPRMYRQIFEHIRTFFLLVLSGIEPHPARA